MKLNAAYEILHGMKMLKKTVSNSRYLLASRSHIAVEVRRVPENVDGAIEAERPLYDRRRNSRCDDAEADPLGRHLTPLPPCRYTKMTWESLLCSDS